MKTYKVQITEKLQMEVEVQADCRNEAVKLAEINWKNQMYILDSDHFKGVTFTSLYDREYVR
jgi:hypothetical protein